MLSHHESAVVKFFDRHAASMNGIAINVPQAQFMPQAIHESISFNSRNREVAIHYENVPQAQFVRLQFIAGLPSRTTPHI